MRKIRKHSGLAADGAGAARRGRRARAERLSQPADPLHRRLRRRRRQRHFRAPGRGRIPAELTGRTAWSRTSRAPAAASPPTSSPTSRRRLHRAGRRHRADVDRRRDLSQPDYHPTKSFIPLNMIASFPLVLVVPANQPDQDRERPGRIGQGPSRQVELRHLVARLHHRQRTVQAQDRHAGVGIPYKSSNESNLCVVSGQMPVHHFGRPAGDPAGEGRQDPRAWR